MLITILSIGSRGDVQPYIALGVALKKAGATVRIVSFENFGDFVKQADFTDDTKKRFTEIKLRELKDS